MESVSMWMSGYFQSVERLLDCPKPFRRHFLKHTRRMAEDFVQGNPNATPQEVADFLGDPEELARGFLETLEPEMLERYRRRRKLVGRGLIALLAGIVLLLGIWVYSLKMRPYNLEVTETIIIYPEEVEEVQ